jgi:hypothetical protein
MTPFFFAQNAEAGDVREGASRGTVTAKVCHGEAEVAEEGEKTNTEGTEKTGEHRERSRRFANSKAPA